MGNLHYFQTALVASSYADSRIKRKSSSLKMTAVQWRCSMQAACRAGNWIYKAVSRLLHKILEGNGCSKSSLEVHSSQTQGQCCSLAKDDWRRDCQTNWAQSSKSFYTLAVRHHYFTELHCSLFRSPASLPFLPALCDPGRWTRHCSLNGWDMDDPLLSCFAVVDDLRGFTVVFTSQLISVGVWTCFSSTSGVPEATTSFLIWCATQSLCTRSGKCFETRDNAQVILDFAPTSCNPCPSRAICLSRCNVVKSMVPMKKVANIVKGSPIAVKWYQVLTSSLPFRLYSFSTQLVSKEQTFRWEGRRTKQFCPGWRH